MAAPEPVELVVRGRPVPKGRPRLGLGRTFTPPRTAAAEELIVWHCRAARLTGRFLEGPLHVELHFYGANPRADVDNLAKLVLDALQSARVMSDDSQVIKLVTIRQPVMDTVGPRTVIRIRALPIHATPFT